MAAKVRPDTKKDLSNLKKRGVSSFNMGEYDCGALMKVTQYVFSFAEIINLYNTQPTFKCAIDTGMYFYYNRQLWLYHPDVLNFDSDEGEITLSEKARKNHQSYCLGVSYIYLSRKNLPRRSATGFNPVVSRRPFKRFDGIVVPKFVMGTKEFAETYPHIPAIDDFVEYGEKIYATYTGGGGGNYGNIGYGGGGGGDGDDDNGKNENEPNCFNKFFKHLMEKSNITVEELALETGISETTIKNMRNKPSANPNRPSRYSLEYIIMCCIVMKVLPWDSKALITYAGYTLRPDVKQERGYMVILHMYYNTGSLTVCDDYLAKHRLATLSSFADSNKKNKNFLY